LAGGSGPPTLRRLHMRRPPLTARSVFVIPGSLTFLYPATLTSCNRSAVGPAAAKMGVGGGAGTPVQLPVDPATCSRSRAPAQLRRLASAVRCVQDTQLQPGAGPHQAHRGYPLSARSSGSCDSTLDACVHASSLTAAPIFHAAVLELHRELPRLVLLSTQSALDTLFEVSPAPPFAADREIRLRSADQSRNSLRKQGVLVCCRRPLMIRPLGCQCQPFSFGQGLEKHLLSPPN